MNIPNGPIIPGDSCFSYTNTNSLYTSFINLSIEKKESINFSAVIINKKQGVISVSQANLNLGEFANIIVNNNQINEDSVILVSVLSCDQAMAFVVNTVNISNGVFTINVVNVGVSVAVNETIKIAFLTI
jgi:hypothetical protein